ncbi:unnamed protein product [Plutella xylostella]|uniref:(diamondback moth) hypothetical protein n=1 Tax=Plutella xylostella TaxID=51655 RepID=A0A8S4DB09_PLUXY|nr:unnamed protein product [Plutella xylostella]
MSRVAAVLLLVLAGAAPSPPAPPAPLEPPDPAAVAPPPPRCRLAPLCLCPKDHFICNDVPFHIFPESAAVGGARHVSLAGAALGALREGALAAPLRTLLLHACRLHALDPRALLSMSESLASLDLGYNELSALPLDALRPLRALNWLNLQNNHIGELPADAEWGALGDSLTSLSLSNNELVVLHGGALAGLRRLTRLELDGNRLRALQPGALPPSLTALLLAGNLLPGAPPDPLPRLQLLQLRDNMLHAPRAPPPAPLPRLHTLDLSYNQLSAATLEQLLQTAHARRLVLDLNELHELPARVFRPPLERLSAAHNRLRALPAAGLLRARRELQQLELDHNLLAALPPELRELEHCRHLSVAYNQLTELGALPPRLQSLGAAGNLLARWPAALAGLEPGSLRRLDLGYNRLAELLPEYWGPWSAALDTLDLRGNRLAALAAGALPDTLPLRELLLGFNDLYLVDAGALPPALRVLELSSALLGGALPAGAALAGLQGLALDNNNVHHVTGRDLAAFASLEFLNLDFNKIVRFPSEWSAGGAAVPRLRELRLAYNYVSHVEPAFLRQLPALRRLDLAHNHLRALAGGALAGLPALQHARLCGNQLASLAPAALRDLPRLQLLELQENRLRELSAASLQGVGDVASGLVLNVSHNLLNSLRGGGGALPVHVLDLSHNRLEETSEEFFSSVAASVRRVDLGHNQLRRLEHAALGALPRLEVLLLRHNNISVMRRRALLALPALAELDVAHNQLRALPPALLSGSTQLRRLLLNNNLLRSLPRDALAGAPVEHLDLSDNLLAVFPGGALGGAGASLRRLELGGNRLEHLDAAMFGELSALRELGLARNALSVLPDNTFASLARLRRLDLAHNALKTNFKELFHNLPELRHLVLAGCGLRALPRLPLEQLTHLELADNRVAAWREADARPLAALRVLGLARNELGALRAAMWAPLARLVQLDLGGNPLGALGAADLQPLAQLQRLRLAHLPQLDVVSPLVLAPLLALRSLELDVPAGGALPGALLAAASHVEALTLWVRDEELAGQLAGLRAPKLRVLEVRGAALQRVAAGALAALGGQRALALRLAGTRVAALPAGLARPLLAVPHLALDLSDNALVDLAPAALYDNLTDWNRRATNLLPGGLVVSGNALRCGCAVAWLGGWLRRWAAEAGAARGAGGAAAAGWCWRGAQRVPLLELQADAAECAASALSSRAPPRTAPHAAELLLTLLLYRALR